jgi:hypothetical protein
MKKIFLFCMMALVAMCGLNSCSDDCDHDFIEVDYSKDIVGTWTYFAENGQAEAMVIKADGSFAITGVSGDLGLYEETGTIKLVNNKVTLAYASGEVFEGLLELVTGKSMSIVFNKEYDICLTYDYCENDLSDESVGMWVCNNSMIDAENDMLIQTFKDNGTTLMTGYLPESEDADYLLNNESKYKVIGDIMFIEVSTNNPSLYVAKRMKYAPMATMLGDVMTFTNYSNDTHELLIERWIRIKQTLNLAGKKYNFNNLYVSNVKGLDKDMELLGQTFNFSKIDGVLLDNMLKSLLFSVEFPNANTIKYSCHFSHQEAPAVVEAPIAVDGNKMTIKVSEVYPGFKDVDVYTFQDQDNCQLHMYMPTSSVEAFFGNLQVMTLSFTGQLDNTDAEAVKAVYDRVVAAIESINLSIILK